MGEAIKETIMANSTLNGHSQRKTLSTQIDRLDSILDGLAEALNESVADAVRDVVGQVVRETVGTTIREVLGNPELLRASLAKHMPAAMPQPSPVSSSGSVGKALKGALATLLHKCSEMAGKVKQHFGSAWSRSLGKLGIFTALARQNFQHLRSDLARAGNLIRHGVSGAWKFRRSSTVAMAVGVLSGLSCYFAGPVIASVACGLSGAVMTLSGMILLPVWRLISGSQEV
jgi:hypothetical protein